MGDTVIRCGPISSNRCPKCFKVYSHVWLRGHDCTYCESAYSIILPIRHYYKGNIKQRTYRDGQWKFDHHCGM